MVENEATQIGDTEIVKRLSATPQEKLKCIEREIAMRKAVYPGRVKVKKMSIEKMNHEIRVMEAIAADYRHLIALNATEFVPF